MVIDDVWSFCAKSRVLRTLFTFLFLLAIILTITKPVLEQKDLRSVLALYGCICSFGRIVYFGRPWAVLKVVGCVIVAQTFVSLALRESSAKLGRSESGSESAHHSAGSARVRGNDAGQIDAPRNRERIMRMDVAKNRASNNVSFRSGKAIPGDTCRRLKTIQPSGTPMEKLAQAASDKNQVMDELLNQDQIPADYGTQMVALFRDKGQDVLTRDFAVQHIGLYAQALNRRGVYDPESADSRSLRVALASRVMAVHLCGEHRVAAAIVSSVPPQNNERKENKGVSRECV